jgi:hypothetical protein
VHCQTLEKRAGNCHTANEDPVAEHHCMAQCFHFHPDVMFLHLHTTASVLHMTDKGPRWPDSGLGPDFNASEVLPPLHASTMHEPGLIVVC